jgi:SAM-dependent methyltransferase
MSDRFPFLRYPLVSFRSLAATLPPDARTKLREHLQEADYSVRLLRYWWAGQALKEEADRLGRPLTVVDLGCERGWLKHFTPRGAVARWVGLDWNPPAEVRKLAAYDEVHHANFDEPLPLPSASADAVVSLHVFEHLPRPGSTMAEISRLLKPGGIFLGGAPTMPGPFARLRETYFRRKLQAGELAAGGHITVLSPGRWRSLATDNGLETEFVTGSHAFRRTGSPLENLRWWIRLNQLWGALVPSLGSEAYIKARRSLPWVAKTDRLAPEDPHWRPAWIALAILGCLALVAGAWMLWSSVAERRDQAVTTWLNAHQKGGDVFLLGPPGLHALASQRNDAQVIPTPGDDLGQWLIKHPQAHVLVSLADATSLLQKPDAARWRVDSRLEVGDEDFLLLQQGSAGTPLEEYLRGINPL